MNVGEELEPEEKQQKGEPSNRRQRAVEQDRWNREERGRWIARLLIPD